MKKRQVIRLKEYLFFLKRLDSQTLGGENPVNQRQMMFSFSWPQSHQLPHAWQRLHICQLEVTAHLSALNPVRLNQEKQFVAANSMLMHANVFNEIGPKFSGGFDFNLANTTFVVVLYRDDVWMNALFLKQSNVQQHFTAIWCLMDAL